MAINKLSIAALAIVGVCIAVCIGEFSCPTPSPLTFLTSTVRDRNDSIRIQVQAVVIDNMEAELKSEKRKRLNAEWSLGDRNATVKMLQSIIDTLQSADHDSVSVLSFEADTITTRGDTVLAKLEFSPKPRFSIGIRLAPIDTVVVCHDSLITTTIPTASPTELSVATIGGLLVGVGIAKENDVAVISGSVALLGVLAYEFFK